MEKTVEDVRKFWEQNPLWTGESKFVPHTKDFFEEHRNVVIQDCFAGQIDERIFPQGEHRQRVLDLGCGPGFWTVELGQRGCQQIYSADLTENALSLARKRCEIYGIKAHLQRENAEGMTFEDGFFSHVNCQGVIHHTPNTEACVREIARVLQPGGTASISVYYKNVFLQSWPYINWVGKILAGLGGRLVGRGRESIFKEANVNEIVRLYDGADNPIGKAYSKQEFSQLVQPYFTVDQLFLHFFPARALPFKISKPVHRFMDSQFGFMIYASLRKK